MNPEENPTAVFNGQQTTEQPLCNEMNEVRKHYLHHHLLLNPHVSSKLSDNAWLVGLRRRTERFAEMLEFLERSWAEDIPVLQKACFSYLTKDNIPRKERQQVIEAWANWSDFQFTLNRYRGLVTLFLKYHQRMLQEIDSLLPPSAVEMSPESQTANQEGGQ